MTVHVAHRFISELCRKGHCRILFLFFFFGSMLLECEGLRKCQGEGQGEKAVSGEIGGLLSELPEQVLFPGPDSRWKGRVL